MAKKAPVALSPWEDRWTTPTLDQLLGLVEVNRRKLIQTLIDRIGGYEGIESELIWHGVSWRWTLQFTLSVGSAGPQPFAYVVPNPEAPLICIPMSSQEIDRLPMKRLNRFIRDGIRSAKCAVETHWCKWTPTAGTEVEHLSDLIKRLHKIYSTAAQDAA